MASKYTNDLKSDPSSVKQHFTAIDIKIHCCRYWKLAEWEFNNMSFPFWRLYYNTHKGASVIFNNQKVELHENVVVLIPPYTPFSTSLKQSFNERLTGTRIQSLEEYHHLEQMGMIDHLFIHFNLGFRFDRVKPAVYALETSVFMKETLAQIRLSAIAEKTNFGFRQSLLLHQLISSLLCKVPIDFMDSWKMDKRILKVMEYIDQNPEKNLNNELLGRIANMATNSMLRLFRLSTHTTVQQFLQAKRIEMAILLMHNNEIPIDQIAEKCGFSDRQHFSKVFKRLKGTSPAAYRKLHAI
jgi:AraC-like DNA-binding protein